MHEIEQRPAPHHLPEAAADYRPRRELQQFDGPIVGEQDVHFGVEGDDAFDHAAEDGPQLLSVLFEGGDAGGEGVFHAVEGASQGADLVAALGEDLGAFAAGAESFGRAGHGAKRPAHAARQADGETEDRGDADGGEDGRQQQQPQALRRIGEGDDRSAERADDGQQEDRERDGEAPEHDECNPVSRDALRSAPPRAPQRVAANQPSPHQSARLAWTPRRPARSRTPTLRIIINATSTSEAAHAFDSLAATPSVA